MSAAPGNVIAGFGEVERACEDHFADRAEVGAAFAAVANGSAVFENLARVADAATGLPWKRGTRQLVFPSAEE
jgi:hypothetical protein